MLFKFCYCERCERGEHGWREGTAKERRRGERRGGVREADYGKKMFANNCSEKERRRKRERDKRPRCASFMSVHADGGDVEGERL